VRKGKIAHGNSFGFQAQIEDLHLKGCIPEENAKNTLTGRSPCFSFEKLSSS
jgi:hypothetical protein